VTRTRVYIATTQGPAQVRVLAKEQPRMPGQGHEIFSDVYLSDPFEKLPIAGAYKDFVRKPTGVVERLFGHPVYMLELSRRIAGGESWKLGAFAAHALLHEDQLAQRDEEADRVIWLTGCVARDDALSLKPVDHVEQKLESSVDLFKECLEAGLPISCFMGADDYARLDPGWLSSWREELEVDEDTLPILPLTSAFELGPALGLGELTRLGQEGGARASPALAASASDAALGMDASGGRSRDDEAATDAKPLRAWLWGLLVAAIVLLAATLLLRQVVDRSLDAWVELAAAGRYAELETALEQKQGSLSALGFELLAPSLRPPDDALALEIDTRVLADGRNCALFGSSGEVVTRSVPWAEDGFAETPHAGLCSLAYRARNTTDAPLHLWLQVTPLAGGPSYAEQRRQGRATAATVAPHEALSVYVEPRAFSRRDVR